MTTHTVDISMHTTSCRAQLQLRDTEIIIQQNAPSNQPLLAHGSANSQFEERLAGVGIGPRIQAAAAEARGHVVPKFVHPVALSCSKVQRRSKMFNELWE